MSIDYMIRLENESKQYLYRTEVVETGMCENRDERNGLDRMLHQLLISNVG
jgi:hypothetical protein